MVSPVAPLAQRAARDPGALAEEGAAALDERRFADALEAFTEAGKLLPDDSSLSFGAGLAAFMLGQNDDAEAWFVRSLKSEPRFVVASLWLGELQYREGRIKEAIATYEAALKWSPDARKLENRLADWRKETQLQDVYSHVGHIHCIQASGRGARAVWWSGWKQFIGASEPR
jgi:tetratricopeptide (TPR) repeat protein